MKTISSVVEEYIKAKPFLQSALAQGIINLTSLSRIIKEEIQDDLGKDVRNGAIGHGIKALIFRYGVPCYTSYFESIEKYW